MLKEKKNIARNDLARQKQEEGLALMAALPAGARLVALAPAGRQPSSEELAVLIGNWQDQGVRELAFLIGGPDGLSEEIIAKSDYVLSLSRLTFTHELARLLLLEQLYRAFSIRAGTGYHR